MAKPSHSFKSRAAHVTTALLLSIAELHEEHKPFERCGFSLVGTFREKLRERLRGIRQSVAELAFGRLLEELGHGYSGVDSATSERRLRMRCMNASGTSMVLASSLNLAHEDIRV